MPMMVITTNSSIRVNPRRAGRFMERLLRLRGQAVGGRGTGLKAERRAEGVSLGSGNRKLIAYGKQTCAARNSG